MDDMNERYLLVSRGGRNDRQESNYSTVEEAQQHYDENRQQGRSAWLYGPAKDGVRPLMQVTTRAVQ